MVSMVANCLKFSVESMRDKREAATIRNIKFDVVPFQHWHRRTGRELWIKLRSFTPAQEALPRNMILNFYYSNFRIRISSGPDAAEASQASLVSASHMT